MSKYDDIIYFPHHVSHQHPPMSFQARAAQFSPFAALSGHDENIREAGRQTEGWVELGEDAGEELDRKLRMLEKGMGVRILYFAPDTKKDGGKYQEYEGVVKRVEPISGTMVFFDGEKIPIDQIFDVEICAETTDGYLK